MSATNTGVPETGGCALIEGVTPWGRVPILELNRAIDAHGARQDINEPVIEALLRQWGLIRRDDLPHYWLLAARLLETAILCAGRYADHCDFTAAGDLLFNPRKVLVYQRGCSHPTVKLRHGRLSRQFGGRRNANRSFARWFRRHAICQTEVPAILPGLLHRMERSGRLDEDYLQSARARMHKIAETIGFFAAWQVFDHAALHGRMRAASPETRRFISDHLCAFDTMDFDTLGCDVRRLCRNPRALSDYLSQSGTIHATAPRDWDTSR